MLEKFIAKHKKIMVALLIILTCFVLYFIVSSIPSSNSSTSETEVGIDGAGERTTLPYSNYLYTIKYTKGSSETGLIIKALEGYRNAAVDKLYELGLNPVDYKITFNYESPFKKYE